MKRPAFFPITLLPNGDIGMDFSKMSNDLLREAYEQFKRPSKDWEREASDKRELVRICDEMHHRGL
jgi:hypothetical protein